MFGGVKLGLDPPPTDDQYHTWARTATRPFTDPPLGYSSGPRRSHQAKLSALWTPQRDLRMFLPARGSGSAEPSTMVAGE